MSATGTYAYVDGQLTRVSDRPRNYRTAYSTDMSSKPFGTRIMEGYKRQEAAGTLKSAWRPDSVKQTWGSN